MRGGRDPHTPLLMGHGACAALPPARLPLYPRLTAPRPAPSYTRTVARGEERREGSTHIASHGEEGERDTVYAREEEEERRTVMCSTGCHASRHRSSRQLLRLSWEGGLLGDIRVLRLPNFVLTYEDLFTTRYRGSQGDELGDCLVQRELHQFTGC